MKSDRRKELGKDLKEVAKIFFATLALGSVLNQNINNLLLSLISFAISIFIFLLGFRLTKNK